MAKDKFDNDEPEEENDDNLFDDDFGLPDLEYDELDDDLDSDDDSDEVMEFSLGDDDDDDELSLDLDEIDLDNVDLDTLDDSSEETVAEEEGILEMTSDDDDDDDFGDILNGLDDDSESDSDDDDSFEGILEEADESDLDEDDDFSAILEDADESDIEGELGNLDDDSEMGMVFEEGDEDEDFSNIDDFDDSDFSDVEDDKAVAYGEGADSGSSSGFVKYLIIGLSAIVIAAFVFMYFGGVFDSDDKKVAKIPKKSVKKVPEKKKPVIKEVEEPVENTDSGFETDTNTATTSGDSKTKVNTSPTTVASGTVTPLSNRNGKAYIVVASFIDSDLALDHANKLAAKGLSPYVIPPFGSSNYSRVGIAEFDSFEGAAANLDSYKNDFGTDVWALRY